MLRRFSLYGFLKNQQYYDCFLLLAFRQMGLSYFIIGLLIAFREIMINIMEIPTGGIADLCGKRSSMIFSFIAYIFSFAIFGVSGIAATESKISQHTLIFFLLFAMIFFKQLSPVMIFFPASICSWLMCLLVQGAVSPGKLPELKFIDKLNTK